SVLELAARIRSLLRRTDTGVTNGEQDSVTFDSLYVNLATREVFVQDVPVTLTYKEYELLCYLIENRSRVVGREELLNKLWDYNTEIETRTLDIHIRTLRQKLGETGNQYIQTVRRVGYRFIG
ncbi:MAG: response regulator transcription factor, partial [Lachnospiraceae bacterium]